MQGKHLDIYTVDVFINTKIKGFCGAEIEVI